MILLYLIFYLNFNRAVVAAVDLGVDLGVNQLLLQTVAYQEVVDAPPGVLLTRLEAVAPPGIDIGDLGIEETPCVSETGTEQDGHLLALLVGETCVLAVSLWIFQVDFLVRHVQVAAHDDGFLLVQFQQVRPEGVFPRHAVVQAAQAVLAVGRVTGHEVKVGHLKRDDTTLVVMLLNAHAVAHAQWLVAAVDGSARVAFLLGIVPVRAIALKLQVQLTRLHLSLLQAEEIGVQLLEDVAEPLAHYGPQAIHVPRDEFHSQYIMIVVILCSIDQ